MDFVDFWHGVEKINSQFESMSRCGWIESATEAQAQILAKPMINELRELQRAVRPVASYPADSAVLDQIKE